jgi:hypothetical protein
MPLRPPAGFISAFFDPLRNPNAPTIGTATAGDASASVAFTAPSNVGGSAISSYAALSTPGGIVASAASSPVTVSGLTNGSSYTFIVWATNTYGPSAFSASSNSVTPVTGPSSPVGLSAGGYNSSSITTNIIDFINIATGGMDSIDFGDLDAAGGYIASTGNTTRSIFAGSYDVTTNAIRYVTPTTKGNTTNFGNLLANMVGAGGCASSTRAVFAGDFNVGSLSNVIQYVTIDTTGNSTDFGDLTLVAFNLSGCSSTTRGLFAGGESSNSANTNVIGYITIASTGNATDFGDLIAAVRGNASVSSSTRGIFSGGSNTNVIQYVTIASTGNATDFGDLLQNSSGRSNGCSSGTLGVFCGGSDPSAVTNVMEKITIASTGNSLDFGDLTVARSNLTSCSNAHGGL